MSSERQPGIAERAHSRQAEREAVFRAELAPGETVIAPGPVVVTDRRVLFAWRGLVAWHLDAIAFEEVISWALGQRHDERPVVRIDHPTHLRVERVPVHRFLRFAWGNAEAEVPHDDATLAFGSKREPSFHALVEELQQHAPRGENFVVPLPRTREEGTSSSRAYFRRRP